VVNFENKQALRGATNPFFVWLKITCVCFKKKRYYIEKTKL
jgi:hypothetical protein